MFKKICTIIVTKEHVFLGDGLEDAVDVVI